MGIHPKKAGQLQDARREQLDTLVRSSRVAALGEIGVDYSVSPSLWKGQLQALKWALMSCQADRPVILHIRGKAADRLSASAHHDVLEAMKERCPNRAQPVHLHCFSGGPDQVRDWGENYPRSLFGFTRGS